MTTIRAGGVPQSRIDVIKDEARNILLNADGRVFQRLSGLSCTDNTYGGDRWKALVQTGAVAFAFGTGLGGLPTYLQLTQSQASAQRMGSAQIVHPALARLEQNQEVTLTFDYRLSSAGTVRIALLEYVGAPFFASGDFVLDWTSGTYTAGNFFVASDYNVLAVQDSTPVDGTTTTTVSVTATCGASTKSLVAFIWTEDEEAQNVTLRWRAQLERGGVATSFICRDPATEYLSCTRYSYVLRARNALSQLVAGYADSTTLAKFPILIPGGEQVVASTVVVSAAGDWAVGIQGNTRVEATNVAGATLTTGMVRLDVTVASGLTAGDAVVLQGDNTTNATIVIGADI